MKLFREKCTKNPSIQPVGVRSGEFLWRGHRLSYRVYGEVSAAHCVLIHGILLDSVVNRDLAHRLVNEGFQVALLDLLGHGESDRSSRVGDHRIDLYAEQVVALLDHLKWRKAFVGGLSLGAITALHVAVRWPRRVQALFLEMPVMEASTPFAALLLVAPMLIARFAAPLWRPMAHLLARMPRPRAEWLASVMNGFSSEPENVAAILHGVFVGPVVPSWAQRTAISVPTLIIGHAGDRLHVLEDAQRLAREIPGSRLLRARSILELRTHPERLWPQIRTFLQQSVLGTAPEKRKLEPGRKSTRRISNSRTGTQDHD